MVGAATFALVTSTALAASAATWANNQTTPPLAQIFVIDATGETGWPYGAEDVGGDGLPAFGMPEQMIDVRTAYAATDAAKFWARVYFSAPNAVAAVKVYVFIDADRNPATGGRASAAEINPAFTTDPSAGGYEFVLVTGGDQATSELWEYRAPQMMFAQASPASANTITAESGQDTDPILINGAQHGYLQANVNLTAVGLTAACDANLFVRSVAAMGGDLEAGQAASCVAPDANGDRVPDLVVVPAGCTTNAQCPGGGTCATGMCTAPTTCTSDAQCAPTEQCVAGRCVARPGGTCTSSAQCGDLVCTNGQCVACASNAECGTGRSCSSTGRCIVALAPDEKVEGGAFNCAVSPPASSAPSGCMFALTLAPAAALALRRRRRSTC
jgi:hypothetical protein